MNFLKKIVTNKKQQKKISKKAIIIVILVSLLVLSTIAIFASDILKPEEYNLEKLENVNFTYLINNYIPFRIANMTCDDGFVFMGWSTNNTVKIEDAFPKTADKLYWYCLAANRTVTAFLPRYNFTLPYAVALSINGKNKNVWTIQE
jgi:hypothetical protein